MPIFRGKSMYVRVSKNFIAIVLLISCWLPCRASALLQVASSIQRGLFALQRKTTLARTEKRPRSGFLLFSRVNTSEARICCFFERAQYCLRF